MPIVEKRTLVEALRRVSLAVTEKAGSYRPDSIQSDGEFLYAFNEVIGTKVNAPWLKGARFSVHGPTLVRAVNAMESDQIEIQIAGTELVVKGGKTKAKLKILDDLTKERYENIYPFDPDWTDFPNVSVVAKPVTFRSTFKFSGTFFSGEALYVAEPRFAIRVLIDAQMNDLWLSYPHMQAVQSFGDVEALIVRSSWAHFKKDADVISVRRLIETNYPAKPIKGLFVRDHDLGISSEITPALLTAIKKAIPFASNTDDNPMEAVVTLYSDKIVIAAEAKGADFEEIIEQPCTVIEPETVRLSLVALSRALRYMEGGELHLLGGNNKRIFLTDGKVEATVSVD